MVNLRYNAEPSRELRGGFEYPPEHVKNGAFAVLPRFVRDGTTRQDRQHNFLNGLDGQNMERTCPSSKPADTCTHTQYADRLSAAACAVELASQVEASLWSPPAMKSSRVRTATNKSLLSQDTRFEVLHDSCSPELGPGHYWIEGGQPALGTLPADMPCRGAVPARDPGRLSAAFTSPQREQQLRQSAAPDVLYKPSIGGTWQERGAVQGPVAWHLGHCEQHVDPADYRYNARISAAARQVPLEAEYPAAHSKDMSCRLTQVADTARSNSPVRGFNSTQERLVTLPRQRHNNVRLVRPRSDDPDPGALGPGCYTPLISLGAARRTTYRLFASTNDLMSSSPRARSARNAHSARHVRCAASSAVPVAAQGPSSCFAGTPRGKKHGPHTWTTDSSLMRSH